MSWTQFQRSLGRIYNLAQTFTRASLHYTVEMYDVSKCKFHQ